MEENKPPSPKSAIIESKPMFQGMTMKFWTREFWGINTKNKNE